MSVAGSLHVNPGDSVIDPGFGVTADQVRAAQSSSTPMHEINVTAPKWRTGEELIYQRLMGLSVLGVERYRDEDYTAT